MQPRYDRLPPGPLTYEDYCELPDDGKRYEILDGELFVSPAPTPRHQTVLLNLTLILGRFVKEQKLPGPLFNDFTNGGYFTWAEPIPGGVYVDGRGEVYGAGFLGIYGYQVQRPAEWQVEMDRRGIQTATLFHWWPNHQALLRFLLNDSRWAVVYYDETTVVAVRREGNAETIGRAALAFLERERDATERRLLEPTQSWQWQLARVRGLSSYANVLGAMSKFPEARRFEEQAARLKLRRG